MNYLKANTVGIDCEIKDLQIDLYDALISYGKVEGYGRVYKNSSERGVIPEVFKDSEYKELFLNDTNDIMFGFIDEDEHTSEDGFIYTSSLSIFFWFNLEILGVDNREDAKAHQIVNLILQDSIYLNNKRVTLNKGISNVFKGFDTKHLDYNDMHPYHCFSFTFPINYYLKKQCE